MNTPRELAAIVIKYHNEETKKGLVLEEKERKLKQFEGII